MTLRPVYQTLFSVAAGLFTTAALAVPYQWNYPAPVKTPSAANANGKVVLFDVSHGGTEGNADWVIDGGFSDFADALVLQGYTVKEYRGVDKNNDGIIQFVDDYSVPSTAATNANEAVITTAGISSADVLVLAESNRPFTQAELNALTQFVASGKGLFFIGDHYNADRNLNTWDSTEVFNGYNRSNLSQFNKGGAYGDLRNPGVASGGWLAQTFGLRFRFNAINWLPGVSDIVSASASEGITAGVTPVLMAGGATLAIIDPSRAKGLVYFGAADTPSKWGNAVDAGLYFGGVNEGPYVAVAKAGAGKAAFIGDSSPIEDATPKYRRQDSGGTKNTYPGWTDNGNAAQLSLNIVAWLATPESYSQFGGPNHPLGFSTANPMAATELSDPDNGQPWSYPSGGYDPWDAATFATGAYGAADGSGTSSGGEPPSTNTVSVATALAATNGTTLTVVGTITQAINGQYALEIADLQNPGSTLYVKLESSQRAEFSPYLNPSLINQTLQVSGTRDDYMSVPSLESVTALQLVSGAGGGGNCGSASAVSVATALASSVGTALTVVGEVMGPINGIYALELADLNSNETLYVKLEASQRATYSPENNPSIVGEILEIEGARDTYMSTASVEYVSAIELLTCP